MSDQHMTASEKLKASAKSLGWFNGHDLPTLEQAIALGWFPTPEPAEPPESVLMEAERLTNGDRANDYGSYAEESTCVANMWSQILGVEVEPRFIPLCMIALKICREVNKPKRDNLVDIGGYANCGDKALTEFGIREQ